MSKTPFRTVLQMFVFSQIARVDPAISMRQSFTEHIQSQHQAYSFKTSYFILL